MSEKIIHVDLTFRCDNLRVSVSNAVTTSAIRAFRDDGYKGLVDATVAGLNAQLRPHLEAMLVERSKSEANSTTETE